MNNKGRNVIANYSRQVFEGKADCKARPNLRLDQNFLNVEVNASDILLPPQKT